MSLPFKGGVHFLILAPIRLFPPPTLAAYASLFSCRLRAFLPTHHDPANQHSPFPGLPHHTQPHHSAPTQASHTHLSPTLGALPFRFPPRPSPPSQIPPPHRLRRLASSTHPMGGSTEQFVRIEFLGHAAPPGPICNDAHQRRQMGGKKLWRCRRFRFKTFLVKY